MQGIKYASFTINIFIDLTLSEFLCQQKTSSKNFPARVLFQFKGVCICIKISRGSNLNVNRFEGYSFSKHRGEWQTP